METNRDLYNSEKEYEDLFKKLDKNDRLMEEKLFCLFDCNQKLYNENSDKKNQITTLQSLNDKYINENKVLKNKIKNMRREMENADNL